MMKTVSGIWSDRLGNRKRLALLGYGIGALSKPLFAIAPGVGLVLGAVVGSPFSGPLLALLIMMASNGAIRLVFWLAVPAAFLAVGFTALSPR
ncbi:MAG TPA: hypothetical protein EYQ31_00245 [Candidatus Handelsmanbacteria bacterium]|nr:hypothetical protein [Candidatus Handelsmanbacteria bacterium]